MAHLSVARIKTIMKSSADVDFVGKDSVQVVARATELFIKALAKSGYKSAVNRGSKKLDYKNLADVVHYEARYEFLREIIPKKITYSQYKQLMAAKKKQSVAGISASESEKSSDESDSSDEDSGNSSVSDDSDKNEHSSDDGGKNLKKGRVKATNESSEDEDVEADNNQKETSGSSGSIVNLVTSSSSSDEEEG